MVFRVPGPCTIKYSTVDLGVTRDGVTIRSTPNWLPITDDEHGAEPADYLWNGRTITVECTGLDEGAIATVGLFDDTLKSISVKSVGDVIAAGDGDTLEIIERDDVTNWKALNTIALPPELVLTASRELEIPLTFMVLFDSDEKLFSTVPSYMS